MDLRSIKNLFSGQENGHHHEQMGNADPSYDAWIALLVETKVSLFYWKENPGHLAFLRNGWVCGSGWGDPLAEGMETHSSILAWRIPWTEDPSGLQSTGLQRVRHNSVTEHARTVTVLADKGRPCRQRGCRRLSSSSLASAWFSLRRLTGRIALPSPGFTRIHEIAREDAALQFGIN